MPWGAIIGAAIGAASSAFGASKQNKAQIASAQTQMDFQERMSSTSYQRSMADMRAAGLNPMLAYQRGGATTPGGAQANIVNPTGTELRGLATTALASRKLAQDLKLQNAEIALKKETTKGAAAIAEREIQWTNILRGNTELQMLMQSGSLPNTAFGMASYLSRQEMARISGKTKNRSKFKPQTPKSKLDKHFHRRSRKYLPRSRPGFKYASSYKRTVRGPM